MSHQTLEGGQLSIAAMVEHLPCAIAVLDRNLCFLSVNARWEKLFLAKADDVIGRPYREVVAGTSGAGIFTQVLDGVSLHSDGFPVPRPDGTTFKAAASLTPWFDADGAIAGIMISNVEILGEEANLHSERIEDRLQSAVELAGVYVFEADPVTESTWGSSAVNPCFTQHISAASFEADLLTTVHPDDRAKVELLLRDEMPRTGRYVTEYRSNRSDRVQWVRGGCVAFPSADPERPRLVGVVQDITERKAAEIAAHQASAAKSSFLATMSHEIRTPLNGVLGMVQAMAADPLPEEQRTRLDVIRHSGEALLTILNDVLDFSKIESGKLEIEEVEFDLGEVVDGVQGTFEALARQKGLTLGLDIDAARGVYLGDPTRIRQILYNLVSNAVKFTEAGDVRVEIRRWDGGLEMQVHDTGIGISPEHMDFLFRKFEQADASTTRRFGGTGLGLAISHELAVLMGGGIEVESQRGEGAVFTVTLPLARVGDERAQPAQTEPVALQPALELRVLAAEDNAVNRLVLKTLLGQAGLEPVIVENGALAVEAWERGDWDIILMDVQMPVMDGLAATAAIRQREAAIGRPRTPIIALTANAMSHQVTEYLAAGMDGHVAKPIDARDLFEALERTLDAETAPGRLARSA